MAARVDVATDIGGFVVLTFFFRREGSVWTAECRELGTATYGRSLLRVRNELIELVDLHLRSLQEVGQLQGFFQEHDIQLCQAGSAPAAVDARVPLDEESFVYVHRVPVAC